MSWIAVGDFFEGPSEVVSVVAEAKDEVLVGHGKDVAEGGALGDFVMVAEFFEGIETVFPAEAFGEGAAGLGVVDGDDGDGFVDGGTHTLQFLIFNL